MEIYIIQSETTEEINNEDFVYCDIHSCYLCETAARETAIRLNRENLDSNIHFFISSYNVVCDQPPKGDLE